MIIHEKAFAGLSVITIADLIQPPPVGGKIIFCQFSDKDSMKKVIRLGVYNKITK